MDNRATSTDENESPDGHEQTSSPFVQFGSHDDQNYQEKRNEKKNALQAIVLC